MPSCHITPQVFLLPLYPTADLDQHAFRLIVTAPQACAASYLTEPCARGYHDTINQAQTGYLAMQGRECEQDKRLVQAPLRGTLVACRKAC
jgi:hypothetical protein